MSENYRSCVPVVLGGYVNAYGLVRALDSAGYRPYVVQNRKQPAGHSRKAHKVIGDISSPDSLVSSLSALHRKTGARLSLFPTSDAHVEYIDAGWSVLAEFCTKSSRVADAASLQDKGVQYEAARRCGVHTPRTVTVTTSDEVADLDGFSRPWIAKPVTRRDLDGSTFRNLVCTTDAELKSGADLMLAGLAHKISYIVSEVIPGPDSDIYAYTAYTTPSGQILRSWVGKKETQYPAGFGVVSTAANVQDRSARQEVARLGEKLIEELGITGIAEPEFKYDRRDGEYKLMEINTRPMMWNHLGLMVGVNLPEAQMRFDTGLDVSAVEQNDSRALFMYGGHELAKLISEPGYSRDFSRELLRDSSRRELGFMDWSDPGPFVYSVPMLGKLVVRACQKRFARG